MDVWLCPSCNSRAVGKVGQEHYYCSNCYIEFAKRKDGVVLFEVTDDGTLVAFATGQPTI